MNWNIILDLVVALIIGNILMALFPFVAGLFIYIISLFIPDKKDNKNDI